MGNTDMINAAREAMRDVNRQQPQRPQSATQKPAPVVQVENLKAINAGSLRAFCSVTIGGLKINSCRVIQEDGKSAWVSLPQQEWKDREGKKRYSPVVEAPDHIKAAIQDAVLRTWEAQREH
jgi:DNA-binding cell septation regulator SpoVG